MILANKHMASLPINLTPIYRFASLLEKLAQRIGKTGEQQNPGKSISSTVNVLLADDDSDDRELFIDIVKEIHPNILVNTVADGAELMSLLTQKKDDLPDLLFLDLNMPGKNGKQCLLEIRANAVLKNLPVIIYSTSSHNQDIKDTYTIGANLYFRKPNSFSGALSNFRKVLAIDFENMQFQQDINSYTVFTDK